MIAMDEQEDCHSQREEEGNAPDDRDCVRKLCAQFEFNLFVRRKISLEIAYANSYKEHVVLTLFGASYVFPTQVDQKEVFDFIKLQTAL